MTNPQLTSYATWKAERFSSKIRNEKRMLTFTTFIPHSIRSPSHSNQARVRNKRHPNWKGKSKIVIICRWHDTIYRKSKDSIKKLLELIHEFGKVAGYEINIKKSVAFLYTNNKLSEREMKRKTPFAKASRRIKY